jgi:hypothetical protein
MHPALAFLAALPFAGFGLLVPAEPAAAEAETGTIRLVAFVPQVCSVGIEDRGTLLDLGSGERMTTVAAIEERCNAPGGYTITLSSLNGGQLVSGDGARIAYTLLYEGAGTDGRGGLSVSRSLPGTTRHELAVRADGAGALAGTYGDVVTVTIEAK